MPDKALQLAPKLSQKFGSGQARTEDSGSSSVSAQDPDTGSESGSGGCQVLIIDGPKKPKKKKKTPLSADRELCAALLEASIDAQEILSYYQEESKITYSVGDTVYIQCKKGDNPLSVCTIQGFQQTTRGGVQVHVKYYFRATEVPDSVYLPLVADRNHESHPGVLLAIKDPIIKTRELFRSEVTDTYSANALKGKCRVVHCEDIIKVQDFRPVPDTFFYIFEYNPNNKRLATIQGEIRVGPSHQARLPECRSGLTVESITERCQDYEEVTWRPTLVLDGDLIMYLRAARSMAAFAGMCDGGSTEDAFTAASMDETTIKALNVLHRSRYDTKVALGDLVTQINPKSYERRWSEEDVKRFVKGLRCYGKNFFKIKKELLPNKETCELVEYYYFWKKTPAATNSRPHARRRRQRKQANTPSRQTDEVTSASEVSDGEESSTGSEVSSRDLTGYYCRNCFTIKSKDWHHGGSKNELLCTGCRQYYEKNQEDRPVNNGGGDSRPPLPYLFKPVKPFEVKQSDSGESSSKTPDDGESLSSVSSSELPVATSIGHKKKNKSSHQKQHSEEPPRSNSPSESCISDSSSIYNDEENGNDGDVETNQDDGSSSESDSQGDEKCSPPPTSYLNGIPRPIPKPAQPGRALPMGEAGPRNSSEGTEDSDSSSDRSSVSGETPNTTLTNGDVESPVREQLKNPQHVRTKEASQDPRRDGPIQQPKTHNPVSSSSSGDVGKPTSTSQPPSTSQFLIKQEPMDSYMYGKQPFSRVASEQEGHRSKVKEEPREVPGDGSQEGSHRSGRDEKEHSRTGVEGYPGFAPRPTLGSGQQSQGCAVPSLFNNNAGSGSPKSPHSQGTGSNLPTPPPLVSAPHTATPSTQPPALVSSTAAATRPSSLWQPPTRSNLLQRPQEGSPPPLTTPESAQQLSLEKAGLATTSFLTPPKSGTKPASPTPTSPSPAKRARSRSPEVDGSDSDVEMETRPEPEPKRINEKLLETKSAIFMKEWDRGWNSCARADLSFRPPPNAKWLHKSRLNSSSSSGGVLKHTGTTTTTSSAGSASSREGGERHERREDDKKKPDTPPENRSADAFITSSLFSPTAPYPGHPGHPLAHPGRMSPIRHPYPAPVFPGADPTPALTQLSQYAKHNLRGPVMNPDPYLRMMSAFPPGSRERLELELEREKRERDAREREMRERELRDMELREKLKHELEMKPPGFDRLPGMLPPGAPPPGFDPYSLEHLKKFSLPGSGAPPGLGGLPGVYPPASLANEIMRERLGLVAGADLALQERVVLERLQQERMAAFAAATGSGPAPDPLLRLPSTVPGPVGSQHTHTHTHAHLHLHQPEAAAAAQLGLLPPGAPQPPPLPGLPGNRSLGPPASASGLHSLHGLPPNHPLLDPARQPDMYRDLLSRGSAPYGHDHLIAAQQVQAMQELMLQRHLMERGGHPPPPGPHPPHMPPH